MLTQISSDQIRAIEDFAESVKKGLNIIGKIELMDGISIILLDYVDRKLKLYQDLFNLCAELEAKHYAKV